MKILDWFIGAELDQIDDVREREKVKLTFRVWTAFVVVLIILETTLILANDKIGLLVPVTIGIAAAAIIGVLFRLQKAQAASLMITISGWLVVNFAIYYVINPLPIDGGLWLILFCIYAFFAHGKTAGTVLSILSVLSYASFILWVLPDNMDTYSRDAVPLSQYITVICIVVLIFVVARQVILQFIHSRDIAENELKVRNEELIQQNQIIEAQNKEKTLMMNEIHHRVKNNLQVINSLLRIQSRKLNDNEAIDVFTEAQDRVVAMALIHEEMYRHENLGEISFCNYINNLSSEIISNHESQDNVILEVESDIEFIDSKTMVPLGLIINELIINSLKHGFKDKSNNEIIIDFQVQTTGEKEGLVMNYYDNGHGFDPSQIDSDVSFGLDMVSALSDQIDADFLILEPEEGVHMSLVFGE